MVAAFILSPALRAKPIIVVPDPRVARYALTLGYRMERFQRSECEPSLTVGLLPLLTARRSCIPALLSL
jgi:hypothetical protein